MKRLSMTIWLLALMSVLIGSMVRAAEEYLLGPGDTVRIAVYNNPDLGIDTQIAEDGSISFPLIGRVVIGGMSKSAASAALSKRLIDGGFLRSAQINLTVTEYRSQQVSVLGEVNRPGKYPIAAQTSLMDLLAQAGGVTAKGSRQVTVVRHDAEGKQVKQEIDLDQLVSAAAASVDLAMHNGDVIYVAQQPTFYVYGEVQKPGVYPLERGMSVRQALAASGGLTVRGTERGVRISRNNAKGESNTIKVKLSDPVQAGDVVQVRESLF